MTAVHAGAIDQIHPLTLEKVYEQQNIRVDEPVDILIFGMEVGITSS